MTSPKLSHQTTENSNKVITTDLVSVQLFTKCSGTSNSNLKEVFHVSHERSNATSHRFQTDAVKLGANIRRRGANIRRRLFAFSRGNVRNQKQSVKRIRLINSTTTPLQREPQAVQASIRAHPSLPLARFSEPACSDFFDKRTLDCVSSPRTPYKRVMRKHARYVKSKSLTYFLQ